MAEGGASSVLKLRGGHSSLVLCVDSKSDGSSIVSGGESGELCVWSRRGELGHKLQTEQADCTSVLVSRTKDNLIYAAFGNSVKVLDPRNLGSPIESFQFNEEEINQIVADEKEINLAACDDTGEVRIISLEEKRLYKTLRRKHTNICSSVCFRAKRPREIFTGGMDCNLIHWDFSRPKCKNMFNMQELQDSPSELGAYMVNPPFVHNLAASGDGKYLACALENGLVSIFDSSKNNISEIFSMHAHTQGVSQVYFVSNSKLISGGNDSIISLWDLSKMYDSQEDSQVPEANGHSSPIHARNIEMTENCRVLELHHTSKINWMKHFVSEGTTYIVVADMTQELTLMPLPL